MSETDHFETDDGALVVPDEVFNQLEALRESGAANMLTEVEPALEQCGFGRALDWVQENRETYRQHCLTGGFAPFSEHDPNVCAQDTQDGGGT